MMIHTFCCSRSLLAVVAAAFMTMSFACGEDNPCRTGVVCQQDGDCADGERCNLALASPECQRSSCGTLGEPCADDFFCGDEQVCDPTENPPVCEPAGECQNGVRDPHTEECDDGNNEQGDGCSINCMSESYYWAEMLSANGGAGLRWAPASAYDSQQGVVVMFGGEDHAGDPVQSTWEFDGVSFREVTTPSAPDARSDAAMAYDSDRGVMVMFGGRNESLEWLADTWEYDGTTWTQTTPASSPGPMYGHAMVYDIANSVVVLLGEPQQGTIPGNTWAYDGEQWSEVVTATAPPSTWTHGMVYDSHRGVTVTFSGVPSGLPTLTSATAEFDGIDWTRIATSTNPPSRQRPGLLYDPSARQVVLFGGEDFGPMSDTWVYKNSTWTEVETTPTPAIRNGFVMAYMNDLNMGIVAFGSGLGDIWQLGHLP